MQFEKSDKVTHFISNLIKWYNDGIIFNYKDN